MRTRPPSMNAQPYYDYRTLDALMSRDSSTKPRKEKLSLGSTSTDVLRSTNPYQKPTVKPRPHIEVAEGRIEKSKRKGKNDDKPVKITIPPRPKKILPGTDCDLINVT